MDLRQVLTEHLKTILKVLQELDADHALAGGLAYSALVEPRATVDIDMLIMMQNNSMQNFFQLLEKYFESLEVHEKPKQFHFVKIWRAVGFENDHDIILDFLLAESRFHRNVLERAIEVDFMGMPVKIMTLEDLILFKKCANQPRDIADLTNIYALFDNEIDDDYVKFWSYELG
ncbi:nucleotidyl transferase AbiEii/AbiGii toxin family protein [Desulfobacterales bacterium HSG2]|nr:nucleotidyl transferase AbiEii/AbiGii toxin family protein [Desulfobacterales bacterium HSG2]